MRFLRQGHHRFERAIRGPAAPSLPAPPALTLRVATQEDLPRIARLAGLDSATAPAPPVLSAELDGEMCVAVSLVDLRTVADPFRFTSEVRAITLARAQQLLGGAPRRGRRVLFRPFGARQATLDPSPRSQSAT
jgi:hypothetical protein